MNETNKNIIPAITESGFIYLPHAEARIDITAERDKSAILHAEKQCNNKVALLFKKDYFDDILTEDNLQEIGVLCNIELKVKLPNGDFKCKLKILERINFTIDSNIDFLNITYTTLPDITSNIDEETALFKLAVQEILLPDATNFISDISEVTDVANLSTPPGYFSDIVAKNLRTSEASKLKYLLANDVVKRLKLILEDLEYYKFIYKLEEKLQAEVKKSVDANQKEYFLREKLKAIHDELGDKVKKDTEIEKYIETINKCKMPKSTKAKALEEVERYKIVPANSAESGIIKTYLDTLIELPWHKKTKDNSDLNKAEEILDQEHYGLDKVKERIVEYLAVKLMTKKNPTTILCLVGPPGVGKTSLAKRVSESLGRKFVKQSLGGVKDESEIRGHRRTYLGALPGRIIQGMKKAKVVNPVFLLDEIDKMSSDFKGDPASAMLEVLDPEQNKYFSDHYLEEDYDLSQVMFICTANYLGNIPEALRDRMEIVELSSYTEVEKFEICKRHIIDRQLEEHGLTSDKFSINDDSIYTLIRQYTREAGVRQLNRLVGTLVRKTIKSLLKGEIDSITIDDEQIEKFIGKHIYKHTISLEKAEVGVVTGLAYTQFGGDILPIEVTYYKGKGALVLTGKLGEVMRESAQAALSYVKTNCEALSIDPNIFKDNDIHIHAPEGAVPKDGPSAGVTLITALVSVLSNKKVDPKVGMTGEITLRGKVLPIGGLREKLIAAQRSGLKKVIIPHDNEKDLVDVPKVILNDLNVICAKEVNQVINETLIK